MKAKLFIGPFLALVLGVCPIVAAFAVGGGSRDAHSCCPSEKSGKDQPAGMGPGHDCCVRMPAHAAAFAVTPDFQVVAIVHPAAPVLLFSLRAFSLDAADSSPPDGRLKALSSSPRSPPLPA